MEADPETNFPLRAGALLWGQWRRKGFPFLILLRLLQQLHAAHTVCAAWLQLHLEISSTGHLPVGSSLWPSFGWLHSLDKRYPPVSHSCVLSQVLVSILGWGTCSWLLCLGPICRGFSFYLLLLFSYRVPFPPYQPFRYHSSLLFGLVILHVSNQLSLFKWLCGYSLLNGSWLMRCSIRCFLFFLFV